MPEGCDSKQAVSVIVYGRNDSHGYNLARRAATSLNALAHVLRETDEILFVDANGADTFPTFLESISDTITERARALIRIIRVRPSEYRRWTPQARLPVHEPFCRNVALRRVQEGTGWVLSTNTDILPVLRRTAIGDVLARLVPGRLHVAPRIELPEALWETLDRRDPEAALRRCRDWGRSSHLDVVVRTGEITIHDGPGDFQLFPAALGLELQGFDESIVGGWHVDGNFCARCRLQTGGNMSLADDIHAYHLDHNRQATQIHRNRHVSETPERLITSVDNAEATHPRDKWGAPDAKFEEFRLPQPGAFRFGDSVRIADSSAADASEDTIRQELHEGAFNHGVATPGEIVFPHLASHLDTYGRDTRIFYLGANPRMVEHLGGFVQSRGMGLTIAPGLMPSCGEESFLRDVVSSNVVVVDAWSADLWQPGEVRDLREASGPLGDRCRKIDALLMASHRRIVAKGGKGPLFLFVSAQHTWLDLDVHRFFDLTLTPWASRVRPARARKMEHALASFLRRWWARRGR